MAEQIEYGGTWWHKKDDGSIHQQVGNGWVKWSPGDPGTPPPHFLGIAPPPAPVAAAPVPTSVKVNTAVGKFLSAAILIVGIIFVFSWCSKMLEDSDTSAPEGTFTAEVTTFTPVDEANLRIVFAITNEGPLAETAKCTFSATDASGSSVGFDSLVGVRVAPFDTERGNIVIRIEDEGAFRVQDVTVRDC